MSYKKYEQRLTKLIDKIGMSKTPVPGLIMGLSGTDSLVAFSLCYDAMRKYDKEHRVRGIHYVDEDQKKPSWFETEVIDWMKKSHPRAIIEVRTPASRINDEESRWLDLHLRARNTVHTSRMDGHKPYYAISSLEDDQYWVVGCVNATEKYLGTYSIHAKSASMWPIATLWKSDILKICEDYQYPQIAIDKSKIPDCICGRDELAASNIELIDQIIQHKIDPSAHDPKLLHELLAWVHNTKNLYDFKERTPYII